MADTDLVEMWLEDAEDEAGSVVADQITYLKAERATLRAEVKAGDWAAKSGSYEGRSSMFDRGIATRDLLAACRQAIARLEGTPGGGGGGRILLPRFSRLPL